MFLSALLWYSTKLFNLGSYLTSLWTWWLWFIKKRINFMNKSLKKMKLVVAWGFSVHHFISCTKSVKTHAISFWYWLISFKRKGHKNYKHVIFLMVSFPSRLKINSRYQLKGSAHQKVRNKKNSNTQPFM